MATFKEDASQGENRLDEESFRRIYWRFYRPVQAFFTNRGFSVEESRDLTQETLLGVYRGLNRFRGDSSLETWLFAIAANVWRNALRRRSAAKREGMETPIEEGVRPEETTADIHAEDGKEGNRSDTGALAYDGMGPLEKALDSERMTLLREAIEDLPSQMRHCLLLRMGRDLKYREIAAVLNISIDTVKSQLFHAKKRLKLRLAEHFPEIEIA